MPNAKPSIGFDHQGIGSALAHHRLIVPLNQREYAWEKEHVNELLQDFSNAIASDPATYFLGTIVLTRSAQGELEVADGQQRLATTTIFLAAVRDYVYGIKDTQRANAIEQEFLGVIDFKTQAYLPRLRLNFDDDEYFRTAILASPGSPDRLSLAQIPNKDSHRHIRDAAQIATEWIETLRKQYKATDLLSRLASWVEFIRDGAEVIVLTVPDHLNAFVMFETLNDRGLKASQADLLKNHLLRLSGSERIRDAQQYWAKMQGVLEAITEDDITVTYLRHLLILQYGPTREREVFERVKGSITSSPASMEFLKNLFDSAVDYAATFNPEHRKWNEYGTPTRKHLRTILKDLRVEQIRPLIFAVTKKFSVAEAKEAFRLFVSWSVRFLIVGGRGGLLDRNYAIVAQQVGVGQITTAKALIAAMQDIVPSDATFATAFADARVSQNFLARYYLRAMELKIRGDDPLDIPNEDESVVTLEHVLPENPEQEWPGIEPELAAAYYNRIGNLVLLRMADNTLIGNESFAVKKRFLEDAGQHQLTQAVGKESAWGISQIVDRQKKLASLAVKTWPSGFTLLPVR